MSPKRAENSMSSIKTVTIFAASSDALAPAYLDAARAVGVALANAGLQIRYGGGRTGLMGAMADGALAAGGEVHGVTPHFLRDMELSHEGLTSLVVVNDMRTRKHLMLENSDAVLTLPGGCGTYEEVFEAMTLKRLGRWAGPIVFLNTCGFYDRLSDFLAYSIGEGFMGQAHAALWEMVGQPEDVLPALQRGAPEDTVAAADARVASS
jgi:uncharacterized protein (TIGR00730 family)